MLNMFQIVKVLDALSTRKMPSDIITILNTKYLSNSADRAILYGNMTLPQFIRSIRKWYSKQSERR